MKKDQKVKLLLGGFHELFCDGLKLFLKKYPQIELVANAPDTGKMNRLLKKYDPDVVMVQTERNELHEYDVTRAIHKSYAAVAVITFCSACEETQVVQQIKAGAKGILFKDCDKEEIVRAIKAVAEKQSHYCPTTAKKLLHLFGQQFDPDARKKLAFTSRELSIITFICQEYTTKEIADRLSLSVRTVEEYRTNILKKIGAKNSVGIALYAIRNKLAK